MHTPPSSNEQIIRVCGREWLSQADGWQRGQCANSDNDSSKTRLADATYNGGEGDTSSTTMHTTTSPQPPLPPVAQGPSS